MQIILFLTLTNGRLVVVNFQNVERYNLQELKHTRINPEAMGKLPMPTEIHFVSGDTIEVQELPDDIDKQIIEHQTKAARACKC